MAEIELNNNRRRQKAAWKLISRCLVSFLSVLLTQFALFLVPQFFPSSSLLTLLCLSVLVMLVVAGLGRLCKKLLGVCASAPAFVFISIFYVWCVYAIVIRPAISSALDIIFNIELAILLIGLCSILSSNPGYVAYGSSYPGKLVASPLLHVEAHLEDLEPSSCDAQDKLLAVESQESTLVLRVIFLTWHIYCVCFNITTEEWINWRKYPELQLVVQHQPGTRFINPYDKGVVQNLKAFLKAEG